MKMDLLLKMWFCKQIIIQGKKWRIAHNLMLWQIIFLNYLKY